MLFIQWWRSTEKKIMKMQGHKFLETRIDIFDKFGQVKSDGWLIYFNSKFNIAIVDVVWPYISIWAVFRNVSEKTIDPG